MKPLLIADAAKRDLEGISAYTARTWGVEQKRRYLDLLRGDMAGLRANPAIGTMRDAISPGVRSLASGSHRIFYRDTPDAVIVLRVLHASMDTHRHLGGDA